MTETLQSLTAKLIEYNRKFVEIYEKTRENNTDGDFFHEVKPFADEVKAINDQWKAEAARQSDFLMREGIGQRQLETAGEHIEKLSIQAYFVKTSRYTFINSSRTVEYTLQSLMSKLETSQNGEPAGEAGDWLR
ncbi:hypothetical protein DRW41_12665 [Neobacillus piezotolerans]|uniref:DUF1798 domain-containing protein n=1 Tax=Neobacillus piezotolerans TaxID=2259171 RepID=A0A3D8GPH2_9BACI|nr:DUF1798 family protein [Neobacillus piezotolerans]RDU36384.1 hypothetical protein DRW41_12665 [Neobacillus piezotolerans]